MSASNAGIPHDTLLKFRSGAPACFCRCGVITQQNEKGTRVCCGAVIGRALRVFGEACGLVLSRAPDFVTLILPIWVNIRQLNKSKTVCLLETCYVFLTQPPETLLGG
jgi:hypothetical protein